jgi:hypothetical protein
MYLVFLTHQIVDARTPCRWYLDPRCFPRGSAW